MDLRINIGSALSPQEKVVAKTATVRSLLTEMNVNYTPNGQFNTFENGMPTQINITFYHC